MDVEKLFFIASVNNNYFFMVDDFSDVKII